MTRRFVVPLEEHSDEVLFFPEATAADWSRILDLATLWRFEPDDVLIRAGEADCSLWFLADGQVEVRRGESVLKTVEGPSVLGEVAFLDGGARSAAVVAVSEGEVARFDRTAFDRLVAGHPELAARMAFELGRVVALRLRAVEEAVGA